MPRYIRFNVEIQPEDHDKPIEITIRWNDFRLWERATGRSFAELESALATVLTDVAYFTARNRKLFTGTLDEFCSGDFGFEEAGAPDPIQPDRSTDSSSSLPSSPASVSVNGPLPVSVS